MSTNLTLTAVAAAEHCGMSIKTFNKARKLGQGPAVFAAHGGRPRFALSVLDAWMNDRNDGDPLAAKNSSAA